MVRQLRVWDQRRVHSQPLEGYVDYLVSAKLAEGCRPRYGEWLHDKIGTFVRWLERESGQAPLRTGHRRLCYERLIAARFSDGLAALATESSQHPEVASLRASSRSRR